MDTKSVIIDNYGKGKLHEFLEENLEEGSKVSIVSAYFTIYAYYQMKDKLNAIDELRFLFGEPAYIKKTGKRAVRD